MKKQLLMIVMIGFASSLGIGIARGAETANQKAAKRSDSAAKKSKREHPEQKATDFATTFDVNKANLVSVGKNPYFILEPGYRLHLKSDDASLTITVLDETKLVDGVETRIVEEREEENGQLVEVSRNYYAIDKATNSVYYFGEDVDDYKGGKIVGHGGVWLAGESGATFGLMMPGKPQVGQKAYQEQAPGKAMDRFEVVALDEEFTTPAGRFENCLRTRESSALEKGSEEKIYAPGVGLLKDEDFLLVSYGVKAAKNQTKKPR